MIKRKILITILSCIAIVLTSIVAIQMYYSDKWYVGTVINGKEYQNITLDETISEVTEFVIKIKGDVEISFSSEDISLETDIEEKLEEVFNKQHESLFFFGGTNTTVDFTVTFNEESLYNILENAQYTESSDAYIEWNGEYYEIISETIGNQLDMDKVSSVICNALKNLTETIDLTEADVYKSPDVVSEDLEDLCLEANSYALHQIVWNISDEISETLTPSEIAEFIEISDNDVIFDEESLADWIEETCLKYKTVGSERTFTTHDGEEITVSGGDYGWRIDYDEMYEATFAVFEDTDLSAVQDYIADTSDISVITQTIDVVFSNTGYQIGDIDWDTDNYSEVDISEQMVYVYQNGELVFSCKCVTGLPDGERDTTTGVWYIKDKKEEYTMTSETYGYTTATKYWIRITWSGIGYHYMNRSDWSSWSNTLYKTAGSHGCINLTLSDAETIYSLVSLGDAVIIHE